MAGAPSHQGVTGDSEPLLPGARWAGHWQVAEGAELAQLATRICKGGLLRRKQQAVPSVNQYLHA